MTRVNHIELNLEELDQLFNTMDPSPFHEKDLDDDAADFILSWAQEFHQSEPLDLVVHLRRAPPGLNPSVLLENAVRNYFAYRRRLNALEFKRLMNRGRLSLIVGLAFLSGCLLLIELTVPDPRSTVAVFLKEGLTIAGWVAMWKPLEIYLYDWWPLRRRGRVLDKLSRMSVTVNLTDSGTSVAPPVPRTLTAATRRSTENKC